ncbi:hypothetical protein CVD28_07080 [Bacillus sp. M6-12]|uniref:serine hydrolase domain-containing protein n=1 Tax=Bacillus sp. M6-12 TaxID=2054166 RepID=UPI000C7907D0|nr:serine hydrolase domain-containing protein [Bacillus sp. M6-12]PLS18421.1 hypothetical protein CVD28_07080 [Bacillus sp. M6-12]
MVLQARIEKLASNGLYRDRSNVIYIGITRSGEREYHSFGDFQSIPKDHAVFEIGSITKVFTGLLLTELAERGIVNFDDPIEKYKPEYKNAVNLAGKPMTLRHLATHTAGLPREDKALRKKLLDKKNPYKHYLNEDLDAFFRSYKLKKAEQWGYSNLGVSLLGRILEDVTGKPLEEAIEERICKPLGLADTVMSLSDEQAERRIVARTKKKEPIPLMELYGILGAGGLLSTMDNMIRFVELNLGIIDSPLKDILQASHQKQANGPKKNFEMGTNWFIEHNKHIKYPIIWTGGTTVGFHSYAGFIKELGLGVTVLSSYHLRIHDLLLVLAGKGPVVTDRIAAEVFKDAAGK